MNELLNVIMVQDKMSSSFLLLYDLYLVNTSQNDAAPVKSSLF